MIRKVIKDVNLAAFDSSFSKDDLAQELWIHILEKKELFEKIKEEGIKRSSTFMVYRNLMHTAWKIVNDRVKNIDVLQFFSKEQVEKELYRQLNEKKGDAYFYLSSLPESHQQLLFKIYDKNNTESQKDLLKQYKVSYNRLYDYRNRLDTLTRGTLYLQYSNTMDYATLFEESK